MSNAIITAGGPPPPPPNTWNPIANGEFEPGTPLYVSSSGHVGPAQAGGILSDAVAIAISDGDVGKRVYARYSGLVVLTELEWNALITGATTGLTPGAKYYLMDDGEAAGRLTKTAPAAPGTFLGTALSETALMFDPQAITAGSLPADAAMFYGVTAGTGSAGTDYAATIAAGTPVHFPKNGPVAGSDVIRSAIATAPTLAGFTAVSTGIYEVSWAVAFLEAGQLQLAILTAGPTYTPIANTCSFSGAGTQENTNRVLVALNAGDSIALISPAGNTPALTVQTADGSSTHAQAANIVISRVS